MRIAKKYAVKFAGHRSSNQIKRACAEKGWVFDDKQYRQVGSDFVHFIFHGIGATGTCHYNTVNGKFFGQTVAGPAFNSENTDNDHKPWFRALLNFVYVRHAEAT